jgi:hypothetical protein
MLADCWNEGDSSLGVVWTAELDLSRSFFSTDVFQYQLHRALSAQIVGALWVLLPVSKFITCSVVQFPKVSSFLFAT